jgi:hypothetical protein
MASRIVVIHAVKAAAIVVLTSVAPAMAAAPAPPTSLTAAVTANSVTLTWAPATGGTTPLGYLIEAALSPGGPSVATFLVIEPTVVFSVVPDGVYYVRVRAGNAEGISGPSNEAQVSVPDSGACATPPRAPTDLNAAVAGNAATLIWRPALGECAATAYVVEAGSAPGLSNLGIFNVGVTTTLLVSAPPGTYFVRVVAVNAFGGSGPSNELTVIVGSTAIDLTGVWSGTSDYINAPFTMNITQRGNDLGGTYRDQHDFGGVAGQVMDCQVVIDVNFGDGGFRMNGTIESAHLIRGTMFVPLLGNRMFTFELTR